MSISDSKSWVWLENQGPGSGVQGPGQDAEYLSSKLKGVSSGLKVQSGALGSRFGTQRSGFTLYIPSLESRFEYLMLGVNAYGLES